MFTILNDDVNSLSSQIQELQQENQAMLMSIKTGGSKKGTGSLLNVGDEIELYPGEMSDYVLEAIRQALNTSKPDGRKAAIYQDLLKANQQTGEIEKRTALIKSAILSGESLDKQMGELKNAGFILTSDHKHYKLVYGNDPRYTFSFAKTPSDYRAAKNNVSIILSKLFK